MESSDLAPWNKDVSDEEDDDWMFSSINSYKHLLIYSLGAVPNCLAVSEDGNYLAVSGHTETDLSGPGGDVTTQSELVLYRLPSKLQARTQAEEGLSSCRDFSIAAGAFTNLPVTGLCFVPGATGRLITFGSGHGGRHPGYSLWSVSPEEDLLVNTSLSSSSFPPCKTVFYPAKVPPVTPRAFSVTSSRVFLSDTQRLQVIDLETGTVVSTFDDLTAKIEEEGSLTTSNPTTCDSLFAEASGSVVHGASRQGAYLRLDTRDPGVMTRRQLAEDNCGHSWRVDFAETAIGSGTVTAVGVSSGGGVRLWDCRKLAVGGGGGEGGVAIVARMDGLSFESRFPLAAPRVVASRNFSQFLVTCGDCVKVNNYINDSLSLAFSHEGHKKRNHGVRVGAAAFHPRVKDLVFTTDSEKNIHVWQFEN